MWAPTVARAPLRRGETTRGRVQREARRRTTCACTAPAQRGRRSVCARRAPSPLLRPRHARYSGAAAAAGRRPATLLSGMPVRCTAERHCRARHEGAKHMEAPPPPVCTDTLPCQGGQHQYGDACEAGLAPRAPQTTPAQRPVHHARSRSVLAAQSNKTEAPLRGRAGATAIVKLPRLSAAHPLDRRSTHPRLLPPLRGRIARESTGMTVVWVTLMHSRR